ncbi:hypothetical protein JX265_006824 [Neoarthrinium moseri]|uniref:Uncharacterized protein n=1 Tax=Neoarthrinium moseri TaxID=1658444 RepID=A0A9P9WKY7_9PEZI|nr:hypothetical protein JX265_006824 [Neoarthrinium moseri]
MDTLKQKSHRLANSGLLLFLNVTNSALFSTVIVFVQSTFNAKSRSDQNAHLDSLDKLDASFMLAMLRLLQALLSTMTTMSLSISFEVIQWNLMGREMGLPFTSLLALSPTTGPLGMLRILRSFETRFSSRFWALSRGGFGLVLWLSTVVLFRVGPFQGSYVQPFIDFLQGTQEGYPYQVLPYGYYAPVYNLVINPMFSSLTDPIRCSGNNCYSYLLNGGLEMVTPWISLEDSSFPLVHIHDVPSIQLEYTPLSDYHHFESTDCSILGSPDSSIAARLCLSMDKSNPGTVNAGLFICPDGMANGTCEVDSAVSVPNITTSMMAFSRHASVLAGLANFSIVSTNSLSEPTQLVDLDLPSYKLALTWLLNYTASNIPPPSAIIQSFWTSQTQLATPSTQGLLMQSFQSILAFPYWLFNGNNYGNLDLRLREVIDSLPPDFYTRACVVAPYRKIQFKYGMFIIFIVLQGTALVFVWATLAWVWVAAGAKGGTNLAKTTSFPLFDVAFKSDYKGYHGNPRDLLWADSSDVLSLTQDVSAQAKRFN